MKSNGGEGNQVAATAMVFENPEFGKIRTLTDEKGEPLFCGKDVCDVLGYKKPDIAVRQHVNILDVAKRYIKVSGSLRKDGTRSERRQQMLFVTESGFYSLVMGSQLEAAERFKLWVTSEVLPQIRKTGGYLPVLEGESDEETIRRAERILRSTLEQKEKLLEQKEALILKMNLDIKNMGVQIEQKQKLIGEQTTEIHRLNGVVDDQMVRLQKSAENLLSMEEYVDRIQPKALYTDNVLDSVSCYTTTQIAKELGCTAQELNRSLCAMHIQYYQSGQYMLYADYAHMGLAKSRTHFKAVMEPRHRNAVQMVAGDEQMCKVGRVYTHTYLVWTERGRKFIHDLAHRMWKLAEEY